MLNKFKNIFKKKEPEVKAIKLTAKEADRLSCKIRNNMSDEILKEYKEYLDEKTNDLYAKISTNVKDGGKFAYIRLLSVKDLIGSRYVNDYKALKEESEKLIKEMCDEFIKLGYDVKLTEFKAGYSLNIEWSNKCGVE